MQAVSLFWVFGLPCTLAGAKNPYKFKGYYYDTETGLYYLNARYYNPSWGRFINADNVIGSTGELLSHDIFAYCSNNPVMRVDPSGHGWFDDLFRAVVDTVQTLQKVVEAVATAVAVVAVAVAVVAVVTTVVVGTGGLALVGGGVMLGAATISTEAALVAGAAGCVYLAKRGYDERNSRNNHTNSSTSSISGNDGYVEPTEQYNSLEESPKYDEDFVSNSGPHKARVEDNIMTRNGWTKYYNDGRINGTKVSYHYFQRGGKITGVKYCEWWSLE